MMAGKIESIHVQSNAITLHICLKELCDREGKRKQKSKWAEIINATNALYNSSGGTLTLCYEKSSRPEQIKKIVRIFEQKVREFLGTITQSLDIQTSPSPSQAYGEIKIIVKTSTQTQGVAVVKYNIYLPSNEHVTEVSPLEGEKLKALLNENIPLMDPIKANTHQRDFVKGEHVRFDESSTTQFKYLKDTPVQNVTFADRLLGKNNKFQCYVSAFANFCGGCIYGGIQDDGMIVGESVDETEKRKVRKNIQKVINKMIWPKKSEPADENEDKRWDVYFEQVRDSGNNIIEDLYVVVVFVAQCRGGVFVEEPECYEIINNEVKNIHFASWKQRIDLPLTDEGICSTNAPCDLVYEWLTNLLNKNCDSEELKEASDTAQKKYGSPDDDVKLTCLAAFVRFHLRRGDYDRAEDYLEQYKKIQTRCNNQTRSKVIEQYLSSVVKRCKGEYEESHKILKESLGNLEKLPLGIASAAFYVQIATLENILAVKAKDRRKMHSLIKTAGKNYDTASSHLEQSQGHKITKANYQQKIYINKALLHLGCSLSGDMLDDDDEFINTEKAKDFLSKTQKIIHDGNPLCNFRKIQYLLAEACLFYRLSYRLGKDDSSRQIENAVNSSTEAAYWAKMYGFAEMQSYAEKYKTFFESRFENSRQAKC